MTNNTILKMEIDLLKLKILDASKRKDEIKGCGKRCDVTSTTMFNCGEVVGRNCYCYSCVRKVEHIADEIFGFQRQLIDVLQQFNDLLTEDLK